MKPQHPKIIKSHKFEDGTFTIQAPPPSNFSVSGSLEPGESDPLSLLRAQAERVIAEAEAEALAMVREVLERAEAEAAALRAAAREEAEAIHAEALRAGQEAGFAAGLEAAHEQAQKDVFDAHAQLLSGLAAAYESAAHDRERWLASHEHDMVHLSLLVAQKILLMELATSRDSVLTLAEAALKRIVDKVNVRVRVNPEDLPLVRSARETLLLATDNLTTFDVIADSKVGLGGCLVDTRTGTVDARLSTQLSEVALSLLEIAPGAEASLDPALALAIRALGEAAAPAPVRPSAPQAVRPAAPVPAAPEVAASTLPAAPLDASAPGETRAPELAPEPLPAAIEARGSEALPLEEALSPLPEPAARSLEEDFSALLSEGAAMGVPAVVPLAASAAADAPVDPSLRAADALAVRLGKKKPRSMSRPTGEGEAHGAAALLAEPAQAPEAEPSEEPMADPEAASLDRAADHLSRLLGKGKKRPARPWHSELE